MLEVTTQWLEAKNAELIKLNVPLEKRSLLAWQEWYQSHGQTLDLDEAVRQQDKVVSWYESKTVIGKYYLGFLYVGSFHYETWFWPVFIPQAFGRVKLNAFDSLKTMPKDIRKKLWKDKGALEEFKLRWADCVDYAFGIDELKRTTVSGSFPQKLFWGGEKHLASTVSLLHQDSPSTKAMEDARMATEIFLKAYLVVKAGLTEEKAKKEIGHNINEALQRCINMGLSELNQIAPLLCVFPEIKDRYDAGPKALGEIWSAYKVAQFTAATITRALTKRDVRPYIRSS